MAIWRKTAYKSRKGRKSKTTSLAVTGRKMGTIKYKRLTRNRTSVPVGLGFPKRLVMTHKYVEQVQLHTGALGVLNTYNFSCNSLFDPNSSGVGHQPMYFDQLTALYDHYTVIGSKIKVSFQNSQATNPSTINCGVFINDDTTVTGTIYALQENSNVTNRVLSFNAIKPTIVYRKWSAKKTFGGSILGNDDLQGTALASPVEQSYYTLFVDSSYYGVLSQVNVLVEITYITVWDELKEIATS